MDNLNYRLKHETIAFVRFVINSVETILKNPATYRRPTRQPSHSLSIQLIITARRTGRERQREIDRQPNRERVIGQTTTRHYATAAELTVGYRGPLPRTCIHRLRSLCPAPWVMACLGEITAVPTSPPPGINSIYL